MKTFLSRIISVAAIFLLTVSSCVFTSLADTAEVLSDELSADPGKAVVQTEKPAFTPDCLDYDSDYILFDDYDADNPYETYCLAIRVKDMDDNGISWTGTHNGSVAEAKTNYDSNGTWIYIWPRGVGKTEIEIEDWYQQTIVIPVEVTERFIASQELALDILDSMNLYARHGKSYIDVEAGYYNNDSLSCSILMDGRMYSGSRKIRYTSGTPGYYVFTFKTPERLKAGKNYTIIFKKGIAEYRYNAQVERSLITATAEWGSCVYTGSKVVPKVRAKGEAGENLSAGAHFTVQCSNNVNVGWGSISVKGVGDYEGEVNGLFKIVPKPTTVRKLKASGRAFRITWKKQAVQTSGYQIQYSLKKNFKNAKTITVGKNTTTSKTIKKLKKNKKYYVRVRTFKKKINYNSFSVKKGKKVYNYDYFCSPWSAAKTIKTR